MSTLRRKAREGQPTVDPLFPGMGLKVTEGRKWESLGVSWVLLCHYMDGFKSYSESLKSIARTQLFTLTVTPDGLPSCLQSRQLAPHPPGLGSGSSTRG